MDRDEYEDYLVDKAKELLHESGDGDNELVANDNRQKRRNANDEVADRADDADDVQQNVDRMRQEADTLARRRQQMDNDELEEFLSGESEFHDLLRKADDPDSANSERSLDRVKSSISSSFSDWENRVLITHPNASPDDLAEQLDRSVEAVKLQMHRLGLGR